MDPSSTPRKGDLVRAGLTDRSGEWVEGVLTIRYVRSLSHIEVSVGDTPVDAWKVTVVQRGVATPDAMDTADPLFDDPGWRRYHDLEAAIATGLVPAARTRTGGTWAEMGARLEAAIAPMLAAGWVELPDERDRDYDGAAGDLLSYQLIRGDAHVEVGLRQDDAICVWDLADDADPGDTEDASPTLFVVDLDDFGAEAANRGWLDPPPGQPG